MVHRLSKASRTRVSLGFPVTTSISLSSLLAVYCAPFLCLIPCATTQILIFQLSYFDQEPPNHNVHSSSIAGRSYSHRRCSSCLCCSHHDILTHRCLLERHGYLEPSDQRSNVARTLDREHDHELRRGHSQLKGHLHRFMGTRRTLPARRIRKSLLLALWQSNKY